MIKIENFTIKNIIEPLKILDCLIYFEHNFPNELIKYVDNTGFTNIYNHIISNNLFIIKSGKYHIVKTSQIALKENFINYDYFNITYDDKMKIIYKFSQQFFSQLKNGNFIYINKAFRISKLLNKPIQNIFLQEVVINEHI